MFKTIPAIAAVVIAAVLVVPTVSQAAETNSVRVSYADLNLASSRGELGLRGRVAFAARIVCELEDSRQLDVATATNFCRSDAIGRAEPQVEAAIAASRHPTVTVGGAAALIVTAR
jgi:UrcA family protein